MCILQSTVFCNSQQFQNMPNFIDSAPFVEWNILCQIWLQLCQNSFKLCHFSLTFCPDLTELQLCQLSLILCHFQLILCQQIIYFLIWSVAVNCLVLKKYPTCSLIFLSQPIRSQQKHCRTLIGWEELFKEKNILFPYLWSLHCDLNGALMSPLGPHRAHSVICCHLLM